MTNVPTRRLATALLAVVLVAPACGTRTEQAQPSGAQPPPGPAAVAGAAPEADTGTPDTTIAPSLSSGTDPSPAAVTAPARARSMTRTPGHESDRRPELRAEGAQTPTTPGSGGPVPALPGGGGAPQRAAQGPGSPVVLASVGTYSGVPGSALVPILQGAQLWAKFVNGKGGLAGHPVQFIVYDDGADPARHRAQVQDAVERKKAIAFLMNAEVVTGKGSVDYITQKQVPVIGSETASPWFYDSPMYFPQASTGDAVLLAILGNAARMFLPDGKKKLGSISCTEAQTCRDSERVFNENAAKLGFDYVYKGRSSLAQPDFTAECLAARNAGAQAILVIMAGPSVGQIAASCARQSYRPTFSIPHSTAVDALKDNPYLDGLVTASAVFPYIQADTPATQEFQDAVRRYGANLATGIALATGWAPGKMLEKAAANLPEPPTSAAILKGLYAFRDETLGGLTMPLTFTEGKPAVARACWFDMLVRNKTWVTPDNFALHCL